MSTTTKVVLGVAVVGVVGGGIWYWMYVMPKSVTLSPGQMAAVSLSLGSKQQLTLIPPTGGTIATVTVLGASVQGTASPLTPVAAGSSTVTVTWTDGANTPQVSTIPVTVA